jgi:hypothetical protein
MRQPMTQASRLERRDFQEQYATAETDHDRVVLCRRWLECYRRMTEERKRTWQARSPHRP